MVKGKGARDKGSRAERKVRDLLRSIYPKELRPSVYRVPLSGGGAIKGDVADNNDPDTCYEVKSQEQLKLPDWWRQAKSQAGSTRTPVLVVTQAYRPFYFIMREGDWAATVESTDYHDFVERASVKGGSTFFDDMQGLGTRTVGALVIDGDECVVISTTFYLEVKSSLFMSGVL